MEYSPLIPSAITPPTYDREYTMIARSPTSISNHGENASSELRSRFRHIYSGSTRFDGPPGPPSLLERPASMSSIFPPAYRYPILKPEVYTRPLKYYDPPIPPHYTAPYHPYATYERSLFQSTTGYETNVPVRNAFARQSVNHESYRTNSSAKVEGCAVCGDRISASYHGAIVCTSCRGFFKRALKNGRKYSCAGQRDCALNKKTRNHCQACRLARCFKVGIKKDEVLEEIRQERDKKCEYRTVRRQDDVIVELSTVDAKMVAEAERFNFPDIEDFVDVQFQPIRHLCRSTDKQLVSLAEWARRLPHFAEVQLSDQVKLLKHAWLELLVASFCYRSTDVTDGILLENGIHLSRDVITSDVNHGVVNQIFNNVIPRLRDLELDLKEWGCMRAITLFSPDVSGLTNSEQIENIRARYTATLMQLCKTGVNISKPGVSTCRFKALLMSFTSLRDVSQKVSRLIRDQKLLDKLPPDSFISDIFYHKPPSFSNGASS